MFFVAHSGADRVPLFFELLLLLLLVLTVVVLFLFSFISFSKIPQIEVFFLCAHLT
jgi:hypothetical protein